MFLMSEILYVCEGANECTVMDCHHKLSHSRNAGCDISCASDASGAICVGSILNLKMDKVQAHELLNIISMAANEGIEYNFTDNLADELTIFIDEGK